MARKKRPEEHDNPDRWVVSYADFITLLFAFFTTLYAISRVDTGKLEQFTGSMKSAFKVARSEVLEAPVIDGVKPPNYADVSLEKETQAEFARFGILEGIAVVRDQRGVTLALGDDLLFASGTADLKQEARPLLAAAAALIRKFRRAVIIEGHTDNLPLRSDRYASNLELSAARAARVYALFAADEGISPDQMTVAGYGEFRPRDTNATLEGRARNRRVDILFVAKKDAP